MQQQQRPQSQRTNTIQAGSSTVYLFSGPARQPSLVQVADAVGVGLHSFFLQVAHEGMAQLGTDEVSNEVRIEEHALQSYIINMHCARSYQFLIIAQACHYKS